MAEIISIAGGETVNDGAVLPSKPVLQAAIDEQLVAVTVVGWMPDGSLYLASTHGPRDGIADLEIAKAKLIEAECLHMDDCG
ncbi:MAG: hypothetical protein GYB19_10210 [Rhodospirillales bacterium]|nr:hypothetical protein [Rhodospirillales bacterium]